ncbi:MAG TPA: hypothetical protein VK004_06390 [Ignavibacteria bacterium]|nr:hypothetical protein [Ignavibacteria bacterium]
MNRLPGSYDITTASYDPEYGSCILSIREMNSDPILALKQIKNFQNSQAPLLNKERGILAQRGGERLQKRM